MAAEKEISIDAAVVAVLSALDSIETKLYTKSVKELQIN